MTLTLDQTAQAAQQHFPKLKIAYKDQSWFMRFLGKILFFNKKFMSRYATTISNTVYFPDNNFVQQQPISSIIILLHELVHINDAQKISSMLFSFLYLTPQILTLLALPLWLLFGWKLGLLWMLLFISPLPSYFRMHFEKRAYMASLYVINALGSKLNFDPLLNQNKDHFLSKFRNSYYYFMWTCKGLDKEFEDAVVKIKGGGRPYDDKVFDVLDDLVSKV